MSNTIHDQTSIETHQAVVRSTASSDSKLIGYPRGWYLFCRESEVRRKPVRKNLMGLDLVAFFTEGGKIGVIDTHCVHMGADLSRGEVVGESLRCPLHHWQFDVEGRCSGVPCQEKIPEFARQRSFPAEIRHGNVYFFKGSKPLYPLPFFDGEEVEELIAAKPFVEYLNCPWYMVGANAVDVQHFSIAHDRQMLRSPEVTHPSPYVHKTVCHFKILGDSIADKLTRHFGGPESRLQVTDWSSTMIFAHSTLDRSETLGMLSLVPLAMNRTMVQVTIMARRSKSNIRSLLDPARARIRRSLIRRFLRSDIERLTDTYYSPNSLIEIDRQFAEYFDWHTALPR